MPTTGTLEESCSEEGLPPGAVAAVLSRADLCAESPYWAAQMEGPWAEHVMHDATTGWPVLLERGLSPAQLEGAKLLLNFLRTGKLQQPRSGGHTALAACQVCQVRVEWSNVWATPFCPFVGLTISMQQVQS